MSFPNRREFLKQAAACALLARQELLSPARVAGSQPDSNASSLFGYVDPLPIPERLAPIEKQKSRYVYRIRMKERLHQMHSTLPATKILGFEGLYPGPTIEALRGEHIEVV